MNRLPTVFDCSNNLSPAAIFNFRFLSNIKRGEASTHWEKIFRAIVTLNLDRTVFDCDHRHYFIFGKTSLPLVKPVSPGRDGIAAHLVFALPSTTTNRKP